MSAKVQREKKIELKIFAPFCDENERKEK